MRAAKWLLLCLLLALPVAVYLFLKSFGDNHFDIPLYYTEAGTLPHTDCDTPPTYPYQLQAAEVSHALQGTSIRGKITVFSLANSMPPNMENNLRSFLEAFRHDARVLFLHLTTRSTPVLFDHSAVHQILMSAKVLHSFSQCMLQITPSKPPQIVLVDSQGRIRGYFDPTQLADIDRLKTEVYVLLSHHSQ